ncbi:hypothetical protein EDD15DRAFT_2190558 [Pisolithus albus]|nr:hypothetical protein EDD15DRAFT_2190558 [Pisolithus albus]
MTQLLEQGKGRRSRAMCRVTGYLPDGVRNTLDNLTPEGRVAVDSAFFEGELSECEDTKGNQPRRNPGPEKRQKKYKMSFLRSITKKSFASFINRDKPIPVKSCLFLIPFAFPDFNFLNATIGALTNSFAVSGQITSLFCFSQPPTCILQSSQTIYGSATGTSANGQYNGREGKMAGMLFLARYWHAIGKSKEKAHPVPAHDIVKTGSRLFEFVDYLQDTELLSHAIDRALHVIDPEFHEKLTHLREVVNQKFPA